MTEEEKETEEYWFEPEARQCGECESMFMAYYEEHEDCDRCRDRQRKT